MCIILCGQFASHYFSINEHHLQQNIIMNVHQAAILVVERLLQERGSMSILLEDFSKRIPVQQKPRLKEICYGTVRWHISLYFIINLLLDKPLKKNEFRVQAMLLVGVYQLYAMRSPSYAVVNEVVETSRRLNKPWARNMINALLRRFIDEKEKIIRTANKIEEFKHAHPQWLYDAIRELYPTEYHTIIKANNAKPPLCLRVNQNKIKRDHYLKMLGNQRFEALPTIDAHHGVYLLRAVPVEKIPQFFNGFASVQDEASQLASQILAPEKGMRVLDVCAAPGGKLTHMLEMTDGQIDITALDISESRLQRLQENLDRLEYTITYKCVDATDIHSWWDGQQYDRILLDVPCSSSGVIRRNPDIRMLLSEQRVEEITRTQTLLLERIWQCLKPDGRLLYSTCSIFPHENQKIVDKFLNYQGDAIEIKIPLTNSMYGKTCSAGVQLLPKIDGHDGFYYSLIMKQQ